MKDQNAGDGEFIFLIIIGLGFFTAVHGGFRIQDGKIFSGIFMVIIGSLPFVAILISAFLRT